MGYIRWSTNAGFVALVNLPSLTLHIDRTASVTPEVGSRAHPWVQGEADLS